MKRSELIEFVGKVVKAKLDELGTTIEKWTETCFSFEIKNDRKCLYVSKTNFEKYHDFLPAGVDYFAEREDHIYIPIED